MYLHNVLLSLSVFAYIISTKSARSPKIVDIGKFKPVTASIPAKATCGTDGMTTEFCEPPEDQAGFKDMLCNEKYCQEECIGRDRNLTPIK